MDGFIKWFRTKPCYGGQIRSHRRFEARKPTFAGVGLESRLVSVLGDCGIDRFYRHQIKAVGVIRDGDNVVLATQTASDKNLVYIVPVFERAIDHDGRTLCLGPQNALAASQLDTLSDLARDLGFGSRVSVGQHTGRLSKPEKCEVRKWISTVLFSNPDMVHYAPLPHAHRLWEWFFSPPETVVIDEVCGYRGVSRSHAVLLIHRLKCVCERSGAGPRFVCCSAAIGNPVEHAAHITGEREDSSAFMDEDTSRIGETSWLLWNPPEYENPGAGRPDRRRSSHVEAKSLFIDLVAYGYRTLALTRT